MRVLMLGIAVTVAALMPSFSMADDQQIADFVKARLQTEQQRGNLSGFNVDMRVDRGTVWFKGFVSNAAQEKLILRSAQQAGHLGVVQVVDDISVRNGMAATKPMPTMGENAVYQQMNNQPVQNNQVVYQEPVRAPTPAPRVAQSVLPQSSYIQPATPAIKASTPIAQPMPMSAPTTMNQPLAFAGPPAAMPMAQQPMQGCNGCGQAAYGGMPMESANLPGYAWPSYAASPNYAAVGYPQQYSPCAWPYIGPFYPYPQVPMGWRKVSLEWDDGWWFLDFQDKSDW